VLLELCSVVNVPLRVILKTEPRLLNPNPYVVPYKFPSLAWSKAPIGLAPSGQPTCEQKLEIVVSAPLGLILKTVPELLAPPALVVP
jgi:hypothetical protein